MKNQFTSKEPMTLASENINKLIKEKFISQKPFAQKTRITEGKRFIVESKMDEQYNHNINDLEKRVKQLEKQLRLISIKTARLDKANNYLKERVSNLTNKVISNIKKR